MKKQNILNASGDYFEIDKYIKDNRLQRILLVCDDSIQFLKINGYFKRLEAEKNVSIIRFSDFQPNPLYESVVNGVRLFLNNDCDAIFAVGGGSAMDVAKCIKLYSGMDHTKNYLEQEIVPNDMHFLAVPTTAGTGSEATRYAVIYYNGEKQSVTHESIIPNTVIFDISVLETLPLYQKKATLLDALCHAIESFWSVNSTERSKEYSKKAIELIMENWEAYLTGKKETYKVMLEASNIAGKAINITQTTAGHAMCYKITSLFGIAHGHAAMLCVISLWEYMVSHELKCNEPRGQVYLKRTFCEIAEALGCKSITDAICKLREIFIKMELLVPQWENDQCEILIHSINPVRLKNNPVALNENEINEIYHHIFERE